MCCHLKDILGITAKGEARISVSRITTSRGLSPKPMIRCGKKPPDLEAGLGLVPNG